MDSYIRQPGNLSYLRITKYVPSRGSLVLKLSLQHLFSSEKYHKFVISAHFLKRMSSLIYL